MGKAEVPDHSVGGVLLKKRIGHLLCLCRKFLLARQNIDRDNEADHKVPEHTYDAENAEGNRLDKLSRIRQNIGNPALQFIGVLVEGSHQISLNLGIVIHGLIQPFREVAGISVKVGNNILDARHNLGNQHIEQYIDQRHKEKSRNQDPKTADNRILFLALLYPQLIAERIKELTFYKIQNRRQKVCDRHSDNHRHQNIRDHFNTGPDIGTVKNEIVKCNSSHNNQKSRDTPSDILVI